jgi:myo-inositol 2-dehydrogenase / D-chiro-inositol 1-dehydrogenase
MNKPDKPNTQAPWTRRHFIKTTSSAVAGGALAGGFFVQRSAQAQARSQDTLRLALVGCGGRGSGAADQALSTEGDVKLVAMADAFKDRLEGSLGNLKKRHGDKVQMVDDNKFIGFDAYKKAIERADVVILATPPGFRPIHFEEAVRQGKNVFTEKPVATDPAGVRRFLAAAAESKKKNLKVGVGLQRHHQLGYIETVKRLHDGAIGDIVAMRAYWNGNTPWVRHRQDLEKQAGRPLTEMEYQMRNWYFFTWLCGDHIVEQHIHNLDVINWVKQGHPVRAYGMGGRQVRKAQFITDQPQISIESDTLDYGEIFDHHAVEFEYADGSRCFSQCRHINGCWNSVSEHVVGTKGSCDVSGYQIRGENAWRFRGGGKNPYQQEHDDLFEAIRKDLPYNEAEYGAHSTMTAIFGRLATYSGKALDWDKALASDISLMPKEFAWDAETPVKPNQHGIYPVAVPGKSVVI